MAIPFSRSVVTKLVPKLFGNIKGISSNYNGFRLSDETVKFLSETLRRKISTDYKIPITKFSLGKIIAIFDTSRSTASPLMIPVVEGGEIKIVFNMHPVINDPNNVDDINLFYKSLVDASIQSNMYKNFRFYSTKTDFVNSISFFYEKLFISVFNKMINFTDYNKHYEDALAYAIHFYVTKVLLNKPTSMAKSLSLNAVKRADPDLIDEVFGVELERIDSFESFFNALNKTLFTVPDLNLSGGIKMNNFIKEFSLMFPSLLYGIDMIQVMAGGLFGYLKSRSFDSTFARLNNIFKREKNMTAMFNIVMMSNFND